MAVLDVRRLRKDYEGFVAVDDISFQVQPGDVFGFLGPNGAGKTTTINMLTGLAHITSGEAFVSGVDIQRFPARAQESIGLVPDESNLYDELTGLENLRFCGALYGMSGSELEQRARDLLGRFGLDRAAGKRFIKYSRGMKRRLTIAAGIIHQPAILFLDEPTTGLDVASARQIRDLVVELNDRGTTVFLTTHYIEEAERLCNSLAFIVGGKIVKSGATDDFLRDSDRRIVEFEVDRSDTVAGREAELSPLEMEIRDRLITVSGTGRFDLAPIVSWLQSAGVSVYDARVKRWSLEDVFCRETGIGADRMREGGGK